METNVSGRRTSQRPEPAGPARRPGMAADANEGWWDARRLASYGAPFIPAKLLYGPDSSIEAAPHLPGPRAAFQPDLADRLAGALLNAHLRF
jgi:hypothetical protein